MARDDRLLTSTEVAELLRLHPNTITSYRARGQMPDPDEQYGRTPLWRHSTITAWRASQSRKQEHPT